QWLGPLLRLMPPPVVFVSKRWREAFLVLAAGDVACKRLALDDCSEHAAFGARAFEGFDFLVGPARLRRGRRAKHDQKLRSGKRCLDFLCEVAAGRQILLVAKDRREAARNDAVCSELACDGMR